MTKKTKALLICACSLIIALMIAVGILGALVFKNSNEIKNAVKAVDDRVASAESMIAEQKEQAESAGATQENDVCIADEYYIRDTSAISDAYKSGDTSALDDRQKETLKMASDVLKKIIKKSMTPYEKEKAVYEWLTTKLTADTSPLDVIPDSGSDSDNPYGVLKYRQAVCVGYATTFRLFMHMLDIDCMVVHDTSLSHSWDLVKLDDEWYHTDCYFDSDASVPTYKTFNLSDNIIGMDHDWDRSFFPKAKGVKYNYAMQHAENVKGIFDIPEFAKKKIDDGEACFACRITDGITASDEHVASYLTELMAGTINSNCDAFFNYYWTSDDEGNHVLCMFYGSYSDEPSVDIPEETVDRIVEAIENAFGFEVDTETEYDDFIGDR